jgi:hypothetical protein
MSKTQNFRIISIVGAFLVGFWLPLRLLGYIPIKPVEIVFDLLITIVAFVNVREYFQQDFKSVKKLDDWFNLGLILDLICMMPLSLVAYSFSSPAADYLLFFNILIVRHIRQIKPFLDSFDSLQPMTYRIVPVMMGLPLLVHLSACGWIALGSGTAAREADQILEYVKAIYWSFTTLTTVGYGDISAKTIPQMLYACGIQVAGVGVFGYILSNVASLLARSDAAREHHMDNLDRVDTFMRTYHIPNALRSKIRSYYHYIWEKKKGYQDKSLLEGLPAKIQSELYFFIHRSIIEKVPFLKDAGPDLLEDLMNKLEPRIFIPGEKIFRVDESGDALYIVHSGQIEILNRNGEKIVNLSEGAFFGELALLDDKPRSATALATTFCDLYRLSKEDFKHVTDTYPEFKKHLNEIAEKRQAA